MFGVRVGGVNLEKMVWGEDRENRTEQNRTSKRKEVS